MPTDEAFGNLSAKVAALEVLVEVLVADQLMEEAEV
jgi:hypothetical protein